MTLTMFWIFWLHSRMVSFNACHSRICRCLEENWQPVIIKVRTASDMSLDEIEVTDTHIVNDTTDGFCKGVGHRELLHLGTAVAIRNRVGKYNLL